MKKEKIFNWMIGLTMDYKTLRDVMNLAVMSDPKIVSKIAQTDMDKAVEEYSNKDDEFKAVVRCVCAYLGRPDPAIVPKKG